MIEIAQERQLPKEAQLKAYEEYAFENRDRPDFRSFDQIQKEGGFSVFAVAELLYKRLQRLEAHLANSKVIRQELPAIVESAEVSKDMVTKQVIDQTDRKSLFKQKITYNLQYHPPTGDATQQAHEKVRSLCTQLALQLIDIAPDCEEVGIGLRKIEEVAMWFNAAIARNQ